MRSYLLATALLLLPSVAVAYPSSVVFSPTGEVHEFGNIGLLAYTGTNVAPAVTASSSWFGVQGGILPQWAYGTSGYSFGGLEVGFDIITPYGPGLVKPVLNAKLGLITEGKWTPSIATGIMEISPMMPAMDFVYVATSKHLWKDKDSFSYGRVTVGYGYSPGNAAQFNGSFPFQNTRSALMLAYESPLAWDRVGAMVEYFGGTSEVSDTYAGLVLNLSGTTSIAAGGFFANDRSNPAERFDGVFVDLTKSFDLARLASKP